jgi:hypothetical protein
MSELPATRVPGARARVKPVPADLPEADDVATDKPNAIDVDPDAIAHPVLTRQGWVCPVPKPLPGRF